MTTILITGASSGLGAEMARQFAVLGYDLALCARRLERLEELRDEIAASAPSVTVSIKSLDVTDDDAVFATFDAFAAEFGRLDRIIVNAGIGKGAPLGTGKYWANKQTAMTNFVAALAQTEAAMGVFRAQGGGHLVMISSMSALRGLPKATTTYAATKAGVAHLVEGLRVEFYGRPEFEFTVLYPGYIESEMNPEPGALIARNADGVASMVKAIEKRVDSACVPAWPWVPLAPVMKLAPTGLFRRMI